MPYRPDKLRVGRFFEYIQRTFSFQEEVEKLNDFRLGETILTESLFEALFSGFVLHLKSFRALEFEIQQGRLKKVWQNRNSFHINSLRYGLEFFQIETLDLMLQSICRKMKRSKMLSLGVSGLHVVAIDGTEFFRSEAIHCDDCMEVHLSDGTVQYVHRGVFMQHVGTKLKPFLAAEPILPKDKSEEDSQPGHEGELTAAKRLLSRVVRQYGKRFIDIVTLDAIYMNKPFFQHCIALNLDAVARVKNERTQLYKEIESLCELTKPYKGYDQTEGVAYTIYEIEAIHLSIGWDIPLVGYKIIETDSSGTQTFLCATTALDVDANIIRRIVHQKWGIENNGYRELKQNWQMEHNFHHHQVATWAIILTMLIAYNLFYAYVYRNMKTYRIYGLTQKQIVSEFIFSYFSLHTYLPWSVWISAP